MNSLKKKCARLFLKFSLTFSFQLKKEQEMQKQMLWNSFQEKNKQLEMQHKMQLEHKFQVRYDKKTSNCLASISFIFHPNDNIWLGMHS